MGFIRDTFFGGAERRAGDIQADSFREGQDILRESAARAESQVLPLFGAAQENLLTGAQGALDIFGRTAPAQIEAAQGGNLTAQQTLLAGLPQFQNAILGGNVDFGALQAQVQQAPGADFFQQQLPQFTSINDALGLSANQNPQAPIGTPQLPIGNNPGFNGGLGGFNTPIQFDPFSNPDAGFTPGIGGHLFGPQPLPAGTPQPTSGDPRGLPFLLGGI